MTQQKNTFHFDVELMNHIRCGRNVEARSMLNQELAQAYDQHGTLLYLAAIYRNHEIARHLIELGADVNHSGAGGRTPLILAVQNRCAATVRVLLESGADMGIADNEGRTALPMAFAHGRTEDKIIRMFLSRLRAEADSVDVMAAKLKSYGCNLYHAAHFDDYDLMESMLKSGVDIDSRGYFELTALLAAVERKDMELAKWLLEKGANVNAQDEDGFTSLLLAVIPVNKALIQLLLEHGANPNIGTYHTDETPLYALVNHEINTAAVLTCVDLVLQHGAVPRNLKEQRRTMFDCPLEGRRMKRVQYVIAHLALLEKSGKSVVESAMRCNDEEYQEQLEELTGFYKLCEEVLNTVMVQQLSLFNLLTDCDFKMRKYARNKKFLATIRKTCRTEHLKKLYPYYFSALTKRICKAADMVKLENIAIPIVRRLLHGYGNEYDIAARKVIDYLDNHDLEKLAKV